MRESKVKRIVIRIGSIGLMLMLSLGMTACSCSRQEVGNTEETTINIITEKDSSGSNQGDDTAPQVQYIGNARVEGNILGVGKDVKDERYKKICEENTPLKKQENNIWSEYYSPTINETVLIKTNKISGSRNVYNMQGERILCSTDVNATIEHGIQEMVMGWDIADAIDKRYGGK